jgi:hypothetical protein
LGARPKFSYVRNERYLRYVAGYGCFSCGIEGQSQAAHSNQSKHGHGGRIKASDEFTFPLCCARPGHQGCHYLHDNCIDMTHDERDAIEDEYIQRMQTLAAEAGWVGGKK